MNGLIKFSGSRNLPNMFHPHSFFDGPDDIFDSAFRKFIAGSNDFNDRLLKINAIELGDDKYRLEVALPGYEREDVKVEVENNVLFISASSNKETKSESNKESDYPKFFRKEIHTSHQEAQFPLPEGANVENVVLKNGVLQVDYLSRSIDKPERKSIEVKAE